METAPHGSTRVAAHLKGNPIGKTTSGPIHGQIVGAERPFKLRNIKFVGPGKIDPKIHPSENMKKPLGYG